MKNVWDTAYLRDFWRNWSAKEDCCLAISLLQTLGGPVNILRGVADLPTYGEEKLGSHR